MTWRKESEAAAFSHLLVCLVIFWAVRTAPIHMTWQTLLLMTFDALFEAINCSSIASLVLLGGEKACGFYCFLRKD